MRPFNRAFDSTEYRGAFRLAPWTARRHPVIKTALGVKAQRNHYANICGVSSDG